MQGAIWSSGIFYSWHWLLDLGLQWIRPPSSLTPEPQIPHRSHEGQLFFSANLVSHISTPPKIFTLLGTQTQKAKFRFKFTSLSVPTNIYFSHFLFIPPSPQLLNSSENLHFPKAGNLGNKYGQTLPFGILPACLESIGSEDVAVVKQRRRTQREKPVNTSVMTSMSLKHNKY